MLSSHATFASGFRFKALTVLPFCVATNAWAVSRFLPANLARGWSHSGITRIVAVRQQTRWRNREKGASPFGAEVGRLIQQTVLITDGEREWRYVTPGCPLVPPMLHKAFNACTYRLPITLEQFRIVHHHKRPLLYRYLWYFPIFKYISSFFNGNRNTIILTLWVTTPKSVTQLLIGSVRSI